MPIFKITKREILVSIGLLFLFIALGIFFGNKVQNAQTDKNLRYEIAIQINNDPDQYKYAFDTNFGDIFAYGTAIAKDVVSIDDVYGMYVSRELQKYTQHTRTVHYTVNGKSRTRIEHYWTWDHVKTDSTYSKYVIFLDREESGNTWVKKIHSGYVKTESCGYNKRYIYHKIPTQVTGTKFGRIENNDMIDFEFKENVEIKDALEKFLVHWYVPLFWILYSIGILNNSSTSS